MDLKSAPKNYKYFDGNGNEYTIKNESIEYIPVKPSISSSGVYNGGDYAKKELSKMQYSYIISTLNVAIKNKENHSKNRVKISGLIVVQEKDKEKAYILSPDSEEISKIENLLRNIISN